MDWTAIHRALCILMIAVDGFWFLHIRSPPLSSWERNGWLRAYFIISVVEIIRSVTLNSWLINHPKSALYAYVWIVAGTVTALAGVGVSVEAAANCVDGEHSWTVAKTVGGVTASLWGSYAVAVNLGILQITPGSAGSYKAVFTVMYLVSVATTGVILILPMIRCERWLRRNQVTSRTVVSMLFSVSMLRMLTMATQRMDWCVGFVLAELTMKVYWWDRYERQSFRMDRHKKV